MTASIETIGSATLYLGDCREILPTLGKVDHVISDPPYDPEAHTPARRARSGGLHKNMPLDFAPLDDDTRNAVTRWTKDSCLGWFIAFCQTEQVAGWRDAIELAGIKYKTPMVWVKPDSVPKLNGQGPAIGYESLVSAWCGRGHARWNGGGKRGVFTHLTNGPDRTHTHMTEKPVSLMRELIQLFTNPGDTIIDPFMGSGTTGVAAIALGRRFVGIEIADNHFATSCRRIEGASRQADMFIAPPSPPIQTAFDYNATDDFSKSLDLAYETIRQRKAEGGPGWEPKPVAETFVSLGDAALSVVVGLQK